MVIAPEEYRDEELNHPRQVFLNAGLSVMVVSTSVGALKGMMGHIEKVENALNDISGTLFDAVIIVGGYGAKDHLWENDQLREIVKQHRSQNKVVAAICLGVVVLAKAGLLTGAEATGWKTDESMKVFENCNVNYLNEPVVRSGNIITSHGPSSARQWGQAIVAVLNN